MHKEQIPNQIADTEKNHNNCCYFILYAWKLTPHAIKYWNRTNRISTSRNYDAAYYEYLKVKVNTDED